MGGPRITDAQMATAAQVFAETNSVRAAADAAGVSEGGLRAVFKRERITRNRALHAQACERGLRAARRRLERVAVIAEKVIEGEGVGVEPRDLASLLNALSKNADTLAGIASREDQRKQSRLTREKTRAEIELLSKKVRGEHVDRVSLEGLSDDELERRIAEKLRSAQTEPDAAG